MCCAFIALHCSESQRITFYDITLYRVVSPISLNYIVRASYQSISVFTEKAGAVHVMHAGPSRNWPVNEILSRNGASDPCYIENSTCAQTYSTCSTSLSVEGRLPVCPQVRDIQSDQTLLKENPTITTIGGCRNQLRVIMHLMHN